MALIPCPHCGKEISSRALQCPHCGQSITSNSSQSFTSKDESHSKEIDKQAMTKPVIIITMILVLIGGILISNYVDKKNQEEERIHREQQALIEKERQEVIRQEERIRQQQEEEARRPKPITIELSFNYHDAASGISNIRCNRDYVKHRRGGSPIILVPLPTVPKGEKWVFEKLSVKTDAYALANFGYTIIQGGRPTRYVELGSEDNLIVTSGHQIALFFEPVFSGHFDCKVYFTEYPL